MLEYERSGQKQGCGYEKKAGHADDQGYAAKKDHGQSLGLGHGVLLASQRWDIFVGNHTVAFVPYDPVVKASLTSQSLAATSTSKACGLILSRPRFS